MSILDIIIISLGVIIIGLYAYLSIKKTLKWRKKVRELIDNGTPQDKAIIMANEQVYKKKNKKEQEQTQKEDIFIE